MSSNIISKAVLGTPKNALYSDAMYIIIMCAVSRIEIKSMMPDLIIAVSTTYTFYDFIFSEPVEQYQHSNFGIRGTAFLLLWFAGIGLHVSCLLGMSLVFSMLAISDPDTPIDDKVTLPWLSVMIVFIFGIYEFNMATLFSDLQGQLHITQSLLDKATDGFCTVDLESGVIESASAQMSSTFACQELVGTHLVNYIDVGDAHKMEELFARAEDLQVQQQAFVTCHRPGPLDTFDATLSPYAISDGCTHIFVRMLGEPRKSRLEPLKTIHAPDGGHSSRLSPIEEDRESMLSFSASCTLSYSATEPSNSLSRLEGAERFVFSSIVEEGARTEHLARAAVLLQEPSRDRACTAEVGVQTLHLPEGVRLSL